MKRLSAALALLLFAARPAAACDTIPADYGVQLTVDFCLYTTDATVGAVKVESASHASGDTYLMKDEGNEAPTTNGFTDEGSCYSIVLTATEMEASRIILNIEDQGTKTWADKCIRILTDAAPAHVTKISGDTAAADALEAYFDGTATAELVACPTATADYLTQQRYIYMMMRNRLDQSTSLMELKNDAQSATICQFPVSKTGSTTTRGEGVAP